MSNAIYPVLPGLTWDVVKTPIFNTVIKKAVSGRETRVAYMEAPMYNFKLVYEYLRDDMNVQVPSIPYNHLKLLMGFFLARQGSFDSFLFEDPTDNLATSQQFGTGTGSKTTFQLARTFGGGTGFLEPVMNINGTPTITGGSVASISNSGLVTFSSAPGNGAVLLWTGNYYFRCRFDTDTTDFQQLLQDYWTHGGLTLYGSLSNKL
jgi:uncharacterized protein (TIGR02217 family)